jgi:hypothetical protein
MRSDSFGRLRRELIHRRFHQHPAAGLSILAAGVFRGRSFASQLQLGDHTELPHHSQVIIVAPVFHDLLVGDTKEMHSGRRDVLARGGDAKKLVPCVGQLIRASDHHQVPFSDLVLNRVVEIRKRRMIDTALRFVYAPHAGVVCQRPCPGIVSIC